MRKFIDKIFKKLGYVPISSKVQYIKTGAPVSYTVSSYDYQKIEVSADVIISGIQKQTIINDALLMHKDPDFIEAIRPQFISRIMKELESHIKIAELPPDDYCNGESKYKAYLILLK